MPTAIETTGPADCVLSYDQFAAIYNEWLAEDFCARALLAVRELLLSVIPLRARILDVCCGSGQMARALVSCGYRVTGLDSSPEMIRLAQDNVPQADFLVVDARDFRFNQQFDAAISTFNSLAHLESTEDLYRVFRSVRQALPPGAPFLFDVSMENAYAAKWRGSFSKVTPEKACIVRPVYDRSSRVATNHITLFQFADGEWTRSDFSITQRCHAKSDVCSSLRRAGFDHVTDPDAESDLGIRGEAGRTFFLCR